MVRIQSVPITRTSDGGETHPVRVPIRPVGSPDDGAVGHDAFDGGVHRLPHLDVGSRLDTVDHPVTVHLRSPTEEDLSVVWGVHVRLDLP